MFDYVAGALGVLMFIWGFLTWFKEGGGDEPDEYGGYAFIGGGAAAVIGLSLAAGLVAVALAMDKSTKSLVPTALAASSLLVVLGMFIGKGNITIGDEGPELSAGIGLILALITAIAQTGVLVFAWMTASGRLAQRQQAAPGWGQQGYPGGYGQPPPPPQYQQPGPPPPQYQQPGPPPPQYQQPGPPPGPGPGGPGQPPPNQPGYGPPPQS